MTFMLNLGIDGKEAVKIEKKEGASQTYDTPSYYQRTGLQRFTALFFLWFAPSPIVQCMVWARKNSEGIPSPIDIEFLELNDNPYIVV